MKPIRVSTFLGVATAYMQKRALFRVLFLRVFRQRLTFPGGRPPSIISAKELNYCVRDGNRCDLFAIATEYMSNTLRCVDSFFCVSKTERRRISLFLLTP